MGRLPHLPRIYSDAGSRPFEPTVQALGPDQVVIVGTVGPRVEGGRAFDVQRWFNGADPESLIVIAFEEGQAVGDCSYPVSSGAELIIAPHREADGPLSANPATLQAEGVTAHARSFSGRPGHPSH